MKSTQQLTRAMKFVAAVKLRRAQEGVFAARPYARGILRVLRSATARIENPTHPLLERRPEEKILALVLTGDRSLCGAFNTNVIRRAVEFLRRNEKHKVQLVAIGKRGRDSLKKRGFGFAGEYLYVSDRVEFARAKEIAARVAELYTTGEADAVYTIYNEFKNVLIQRLQVEKILPLSPELIVAGKTEEEEPREHGAALPVQPAAAGTMMLVDYIYEQPPEQIFNGLLPRYLEAEIFRVLLESSAAEHAARMTAMDSATNNAADLIEQLTLQMNKIRQASITKEILEVVSGAEALR